MTRELELFVYVIGLAGSSFPIDIENSKTVGHLKEVIKKKKAPELDNLAARSTDALQSRPECPQ